MAINPRDDYESLAKLLYPSIEASGNVYYGQTRKLTMDEVLKKNDLGFESHVRSFRVNDDTSDYGFKYKSYFNWKLGPLKGSIRIEPLEDESFTFANFPDQYDSSTGSWAPVYVLDKGNIKDCINADELEPLSTSFGGALFAKYNIVKSSKNVDNSIYSGLYKTYESDILLEFNGLYLTNRCSPINGDDGVNNFYISESSLYIHIGTLGNFVYNDPLTITAKGSGTLTVELRMSGNVPEWGAYSPSYDIKKSGGDWVTYDSWTFYNQIDTSRHVDSFNGRDCSSYSVLTSISLSDGESIQIKSDNPGFGEAEHYTYFNITGTGNTEAILSGDITSMRGVMISQSQGYRFNRMFCANPLITSSSKLILSSIGTIGEDDFFDLFWNCTGLVDAPDMSKCIAGGMSCGTMFEGCTSLVIPPKLPSKIYYPGNEPAYPYNSHFNYMFNGCSSLEESPIIGYTNTSLEECAIAMFYGCTSLKKLYCYATPSYIYRFTETNITDGTFYCRTGTGNQWQYYRAVPSGWAIVEEDYHENTNDLHGYNLHFAEIDEYNYSPDQLIISGSNSQTNGRGDITNESTLENMEKSFDENNTHEMNTYNLDGSYNQEIWGYKSFNSPVQFRNGVYSDSGSIISSNITNSVGDVNELLISPFSVNSSDWDYNYNSNSFIVTSSYFTNNESYSNREILYSAIISSYDTLTSPPFAEDFLRYSGGYTQFDFNSLPSSASGMYTTSIIKNGYLGITFTGCRTVLFAGKNGIYIDDSRPSYNDDTYPILCNGNIQSNSSAKFEKEVSAKKFNGCLPRPILPNTGHPRFSNGSMTVIKISFSLVDDDSGHRDLDILPGSIISRDSDNIIYLHGYAYKNQYDVWIYESTSSTLKIQNLSIYACELDGSINADYPYNLSSALLYSINDGFVLLNRVGVNNKNVNTVALIQVGSNLL